MCQLTCRQIKKSMPPSYRTRPIMMRSGLSNYAELVTHSTDPNDSDSDDDGLTDGEEVSIGLDPNAANTALMTFFNTRESTARSDGNTSGIAWCRQILGPNLFTQAEVNASSATRYGSGVNDGNTSGIAWRRRTLGPMAFSPKPK